MVVGIASITGQLNTAVADLDLATSLERWPAYQAMILLISAVQRASEALTADVERLISLRVDRPLPLLAICAEVYGPELAAE